jgi:hypothetical protein
MDVPQGPDAKMIKPSSWAVPLLLQTSVPTGREGPAAPSDPAAGSVRSVPAPRAVRADPRDPPDPASSRRVPSVSRRDGERRAGRKAGEFDVGLEAVEAGDLADQFGGDQDSANSPPTTAVAGNGLGQPSSPKTLTHGRFQRLNRS